MEGELNVSRLTGLATVGSIARMKRLFFWTVGIIGSVLILGALLPEPRTKPSPAVIKPPVDVNKALTYCLLPKAQFGQYSSYDGGKGAFALLTDGCPAEMAAYVEKCEKDSGANEQVCGRNALMIAQAAIKTFNK
jgi:hypothetical protein